MPGATTVVSSVPALTSASAGTCGSGTTAVVFPGGVWSLSPVAVLLTVPPFRSAWVSVYAPVHTRLAPGASVAGWDGMQTSVPSFGSAIVTPVSVTLPTFVAVSV